MLHRDHQSGVVIVEPFFLAALISISQGSGKIAWNGAAGRVANISRNDPDREIDLLRNYC